MISSTAPAFIAAILIAVAPATAGASPASAPTAAKGDRATRRTLDLNALYFGDTRVALSAQSFVGHESSWADGDEGQNAFILDRAEVGVDFRWRGRLGGELRLEAIRSAAPQSQLGVDGNSLLLRVKRAWAFYTHSLGPITLSARGGLIPDPWVETLEGNYDLRDLSPTLAESGAFFDTSDLGGQLRISGWKGLFRVTAALTNGEGRNQVEQNEGKNLHLVLSVVPLRFRWRFLEETSVGLHGVYRNGSMGAGSTKNHRLGGAMTLRSRNLFLGSELTFAMGHGGRAERDVLGIGAYANATFPCGWLGGAVRYDHLDTDRDASDAIARTVTVALYSEPSRALARGALPGRLRIYLAYRFTSVGANVGPIAGVAAARDSHALLLRLGLLLGRPYWSWS